MLGEIKRCYNCFQTLEGEGPCPYCGFDKAQMEGKYPAALPYGTVLGGKYVVGRVLGQGGFGITYKAFDPILELTVAVKEYLPDTMATRSLSTTQVTIYTGTTQDNFKYGVSCFLDEARTLAKLSNGKSMVPVRSFFEENGTAYFVMDYVEGISFKAYIQNHGGKVSLQDALRVMLPVIESLAQVHQSGIIHRDVTPDNIYITKNDDIKLLDFGSARYSMGDKSKSLDVILKPGFAPKEQYMRRGRQGPYTDVYSVAACIYAAVTGYIPPESLERMEKDTLAPPSALGIPMTPAMEQAILKGLAVQQEERFQTMEEFKAALVAANPPQTQPVVPAAPPFVPPPIQLLPVQPAAAGEASPRGVTQAAASIPTPPPQGAPTKNNRGRVVAICAGVLAAIVLLAVVGQNMAKKTIPIDEPSSQAEPANAAVESEASQTPSPQEILSAKGKPVKVALDEYFLAILHESGKVTIIDYFDMHSEEKDYETWTDIVQIESVGGFLFALAADGTVKTYKGFYTREEYEVSGWTDIVQLSRYDHLLGLKKDGTVVAAGSNYKNRCNVSGFTDIVRVAAGHDFSAGLKSDGTVVVAGDKADRLFQRWEPVPLTYIAAGDTTITGITPEGKTEVISPNGGSDGAMYWNRTVMHVVGLVQDFGLKDDGSVVFSASGSFYDRAKTVEEWRNVVDLDFTSSLIGLKEDGSLYILGEEDPDLGVGRMIERWHSSLPQSWETIEDPPVFVSR